MTKEHLGWTLSLDANGFYVFCDDMSRPKGFLVDKSAAEKFWLGIFGPEFISKLDKSLQYISCTASCFEGGTICSCGAEKARQEIREILDTTRQWIDGTYWNTFNK